MTMEEVFVQFYRPGTLNAGPVEWQPSEEGRKQFAKHQSSGIEPECPDPYYLVLEAGKKAFDFMSSELYRQATSSAWPGLLQLWQDYEGERWKLPFLLKWWEKVFNTPLPKWAGQESHPEGVIL